MCQWLISERLEKMEVILLLRITSKEPSIFNILFNAKIFKVFAFANCLFTLSFYSKVRLQRFEVNMDYKI
jgi:hypothetical protein